jgi:tetratricopeptide (TPR) repeat protein
MKSTIFGVCLAVALACSFPSALVSQGKDKLIEEGDHFSTVTFENQKALDKFLQAEKIAPKDYETLWRISRSYVDIGEHLPGKSDQEKAVQLEYYSKALHYADLAVSANPNGSMGYLRRAIANGRVALFKGIWAAVDLVKQVKADCEKALSLDAKNASAYYILARTHAKLCEKSKIVRWPLGLGWANRDEATTMFEKAISMRPSFIMYRIDAAKNYIENDDEEKAKQQLVAVASLPKEDEDDDALKREAKELLEKLK